MLRPLDVSSMTPQFSKWLGGRQNWVGVMGLATPRFLPDSLARLVEQGFSGVSGMFQPELAVSFGMLGNWWLWLVGYGCIAQGCSG